MRHSTARMGRDGRGRAGVARNSLAGPGTAEPGLVCLSAARRGMAVPDRNGSAGQRIASRGFAKLAQEIASVDKRTFDVEGRGLSRRSQSELGGARQAWSGWGWRGEARHGKAVMGRRGLSRRGLVMRGEARLRHARACEARLSGFGGA
jgi:hypothetical protein